MDIYHYKLPVNTIPPSGAGEVRQDNYPRITFVGEAYGFSFSHTPLSASKITRFIWNSSDETINRNIHLYSRLVLALAPQESQEGFIVGYHCEMNQMQLTGASRTTKKLKDSLRDLTTRSSLVISSPRRSIFSSQRSEDNPSKIRNPDEYPSKSHVSPIESQQ